MLGGVVGRVYWRVYNGRFCGLRRGWCWRGYGTWWRVVLTCSHGHALFGCLLSHSLPPPPLCDTPPGGCGGAGVGERSTFGIADTGAVDGARDAAQSTSLTSRYENTSAILDSAVLTSLTEPAALQDLRSVLADSLSRVSRPRSASALLVSTDHGVLRSAYVGTCAFVVVRGEAIIYRSPRAGSVAALERAFGGVGSGGGCGEPPGGAPEGASGPRRADGAAAGRPWERRSLPPIGSAALEVQDGDVVVAGSDGFFANVSERQVLALLRPTDTAHDSTLSIANNTCLATWTSDDPVYLAYMLAHLAYSSVSTDMNGDVTVVVAVVGTAA